MLSKYHPVGVMIYGNAELLGVSWETAIKSYREILGSNPFDTVEEAISQLEITLDKATAQNEDRLKIIHAHGTIQSCNTAACL